MKSPTQHQRLFALTLLAGIGLILSSTAGYTQTKEGQDPPEKPALIRSTDSAPNARTSITGRIVGEGGEPLPGIQVTVLPAGVAGFTPPNQLKVSATDENGNFAVDSVGPGLYRITAFMRGYVPDPMTVPIGAPSPLYRAGDHASLRMVKGGVITGTVVDSTGEPVVAATVRAHLLRDLEGGNQAFGYSMEDQADDRGVFRIFGLREGIYVVSAGLATFERFGFGTENTAEHDARTFYPSSTRDTASELTVRAGQETNGIEVRYRGDKGRRITGVVIAPPGQQLQASIIVSLVYGVGGGLADNSYIPPESNVRSFSFNGVADGEYEIRARTSDNTGGFGGASPYQRVTVTGGDITGLRLTLTPLAAISGQLVTEPLEAALANIGHCQQTRPPLFPQEVMVSAIRQGGTNANKNQSPFRQTRYDFSPEKSGSFTIRNLEDGPYRLAMKIADENWYWRALQLSTPSRTGVTRRPPGATRPAAPTTTTNLFDLKAGRQESGVVLRVAEGAALFGGRLVPRTMEVALPLPTLTRLYLVPAENEQSQNQLRYHETVPAADGTFAFRNLAPGKYLVLLRVTAETHVALDDPSARAGLRKEAEAVGTTVELAACQRTDNYELRFPITPAK